MRELVTLFWMLNFLDEMHNQEWNWNRAMDHRKGDVLFIPHQWSNASFMLFMKCCGSGYFCCSVLVSINFTDWMKVKKNQS